MNPYGKLNQNSLIATNIKWDNETVNQKSAEVYSKMNEKFNLNSKDREIIDQAQIESFNLNLSALEKYFSPGNLIVKNPKTIDQLYALTTNLSKDVSEKQDPNRANLFLSSHGISLTKTDKEISDLKNYMQTRYDLTTEVQRIPISQKFSFKDYDKYFHTIDDESIRKDTNTAIKFPRGRDKKLRQTTLSFYNHPINTQNEEMRSLDDSIQLEHVLMTVERPGFYPKSYSKPLYERKLIDHSSNIINPVTPIKHKTFDTQFKMKSDIKQSLSATGMMLNNLRRNNGTNLNSVEDETLISLFDNYFNNMKHYFYYKSKGEILPDLAGFLFNQSEIKFFNDVKREKSNFMPVCIAINDHIAAFDKSSDSYRKILFDLLKTQLDPTNYVLYKVLTVNKLLTNSTIFYEKEFLKKVINSCHEITIDTEKVDVAIIDYSTKIKAIKSYASSLIYGKLMSSGVKYQDGQLLTWGTIYYLMRCGLKSDLIKFLNQNKSIVSELAVFLPYYENFINEDKLQYDIYTQFLEFIKSKSEIQLNPFRHACFVLMTKINQSVNENVLETLEDYIWFHLSLIIEKPNIETLKNEKNINAKFITLKEFQDFIKRNGTDNFEMHSHIHIDYLKCLFSLCLFEDGLNYLSTKPEHLVDTVNISFLLKEISMFRNFTINDTKENIVDRVVNDDENDFIINKWIEPFVEYYMHPRLFQVLNYIKFNYRGNKLEKMGHVIITTSKYSVLLDVKELKYNIKDKAIYMSDLLSEKEITNLVSIIISTAISTTINSSFESKSNFDVLVQLAKKYKMYSDLIQLIISDCVEVITAKTPKRIFKPEIHSKPAVVNPSMKIYTDTRYEKTITEKYREVIDEIGANISNYDNTFRLNFKFLRQLENVEEIYDNITKENYNKALDNFLKSITFIPFKSDEDVRAYMNKEYVSMHEGLKKLLPDICYLFVFLLIKKVSELKTSDNLKRNENYETKQKEIDVYIKYIDIVSKFIDSLINSRVLKNTEKFKLISGMVVDFSLKY